MFNTSHHEFDEFQKDVTEFALILSQCKMVEYKDTNVFGIITDDLDFIFEVPSYAFSDPDNFVLLPLLDTYFSSIGNEVEFHSNGQKYFITSNH